MVTSNYAPSSELDGYDLTCVDVARLLRYHPQYVRHLAQSAKLPCIKRGRMWLFRSSEVKEYLRVKTFEAQTKSQLKNDTHNERKDETNSLLQ